MLQQDPVFPLDRMADAIDKLHAATAIYTTDPIVDQLLDRINWPHTHGNLVDPSCGDGAFLLRALERLLLTIGAHDDKALLRVEGWEIHPQACNEARQRIATRLIVAGRSASDATRLAKLMVKNSDFLTESPNLPTWDTIAGNPPYLRWLGVPVPLRRQYSGVVPGYASADLLHSFLDRCTKALRPDGVIAFVTADRWLVNKQAAELREMIGKSVSIAHLERLDAKTAFYRPKQRRLSTPARVHPVAVVLTHGGNALQITKQAIYPGVDASTYAGLPTLGSIAQVKLAPWLGTDGVFVVDALTTRKLPQDFLVPVVTASDLTSDGVRPASKYAIRTVPGEVPPQAIQDHLRQQMPRMSPRGRKGSPWTPPETFHRWDLSRPTLMIPRISLNAYPHKIEAGRLPIDHHLSISCSSQELLDKIAEALRHPLSTRWLQEHAQRLEDGYVFITATLLRQLPLILD